MATSVKRRSYAADIIRALGGNEKTGMCRCPVPGHEDTKPSLKVSDGDKGPVWHCHTGCSQEAVTDALRSMGLWGGGADRRGKSPDHDDDDLPPGMEEYNRFRRAFAILRLAAKNSDQPTAYLEARGIDACPENAMILSAEDSRRLGERNFPAMVFPIIGRKGLLGAHVTWLNLEGVDKFGGTTTPRKAYGVIKGGYIPLGWVDPDGQLVVAEGVETALSVSQITGLPAVTTVNAGNMANVKLPSCGEVIIAADNDKAGRAAAKKLKRRLRLRGTAVRVAAPEGPDKYDWNDALRSGTDVAALCDAIMTAKRYRPIDNIAVGVEDFMMLDFPPREYLLRPWLTTTGLVMIHADRGVGKSILAMAIAAAVGRGVPLMKWSCERQVPVLYVDGELPGALLQKRLGWLQPQPTNTQFKIINRDRIVRLKKAPLDLATEEDRDLLDRFIERNNSGLIILDSILTLFSHDTQKDAQPWVPVQDWAYRHRDAGRTIAYIHHESKGGSPFGTMLREVQLDTVIKLTRDHRLEVGEDETAFRLHFTKGRDAHGEDLAPMVVRFTTASGVLEWTDESESADNAARILTLKREGYSQKDIAIEVDITESAVSQHVKRLRQAGKL